MRNALMLVVFVFSAYFVLTAGQPDCSPSWCSYNELRAESLSAKDDYVELGKINSRIDIALEGAVATGSRAVYALELLLANNLMRMDSPDDAAMHYERAYKNAAPDKRGRIGVAWWSAKKTAADKVLKACGSSCNADDAAAAHAGYLWLQANKELIPVDWFDRVFEELKTGARRTATKK